MRTRRGRIALDDRDEGQTQDHRCQACRGTGIERERHWFYSFGSLEALQKHLHAEYLGFTDEQMRRIASWYEECRERVHTLETQSTRWGEAADGRRRWTLYAPEAKTPDEMDALALELLSPKAAETVAVWTRLWRATL